MTSYIMYDILKPSVFLKIWRRAAPSFISGGGAQTALIRLWPKFEVLSLSSQYRTQPKQIRLLNFVNNITQMYMKAN